MSKCFATRARAAVVGHPAGPKKTETTGLPPKGGGRKRRENPPLQGRRCRALPAKSAGVPTNRGKARRYKIEDRAARSSRESGVKPPHSKGARLRKRPLQTHGQKRPRRSAA